MFSKWLAKVITNKKMICVSTSSKTIYRVCHRLRLMEMIIFKSNLTTFEASIMLGAAGIVENWLGMKNKQI